VLFGAEIFDVTNDPIAVGILGAVRVMMITKYLPDLTISFSSGSALNFLLFSMISITYHHIMEDSSIISPLFYIGY